MTLTLAETYPQFLDDLAHKSQLHPSTIPETFLEMLEKQLDAAYQLVADNLPENTKARLETVADKTRFILEPVEGLAKPASLANLREAVHALLPRVNIADTIQEVAAWTGCLDDFIHISEGPIRAKHLPLSLCAVLLSEATNLGLSPLVDPNNLARHKTNNDLIGDNWDDMQRATGSLQMSAVKPSELIKSLHRAGRNSTLGRAICELGRIEKTLLLLSWVDDISYRRRVLTHLTRIEHRHRLAGGICFGRNGKLYEQYREDQVDELNTLGRVLNMVVLWTTRYMDAAINYLKQTGFEVRDEDVERLSPLVSHHINFGGKYHFSLPDVVKRRELRPFHKPSDMTDKI